MVVNGTIADVSPERYDTVRLGMNNATNSALVTVLTAIPRAMWAICTSVINGILPGSGGMPGMGGGGRGSRPQGPDEIRVPGTPFAVDADDGTAWECYLRGEMRGGALRLGDHVRVEGRVNRRTGVVEVKQLHNSRSGAITSGYVDPKARMAGVRAAMQALVLIMIILALLSMCGTLV